MQSYSFLRKSSFALVCKVLFVTVLLSPEVFGQGAMDNTTSTPVPGVGHNYIADLNEIVSPASGSVSVRIQAPKPRDRGLDPALYAFAYDSAGQFTLLPGYGQCPTGYSPSCVAISSVYQGTVAGFPSGGLGFSNGGNITSFEPNQSNTGQPGSIAFQVLNLQETVGALPGAPPGGTGGTITCNYRVGYTYIDPNGGRHPLGFTYVPTGNRTIQTCAGFGISGQGTQYGGDDVYQSTIDDNGIVTIYDAHGDQLNPTRSSGVEDSNGNLLNGTGRTYSQSATSLSVAGLASPYTYAVALGLPNANAQSPYPFAPKKTSNSDSNCPSSFVGAVGGYTGSVVITLPNNQTYKFTADPTYGLLKKITYPTGATVTYTWDIDPKSESFYAGGVPNVMYCAYQYGVPRITSRVVSLDGVRPSSEQDFSYSTLWPADTASRIWTSKTTKVITKDLLSGGMPAYETDYTYTPIGTLVTNGGYAPVESSIVYKDVGGVVLKTITKVWRSVNSLAAECTTLPNGKTSGVFYQDAGFASVITDRKEFDFGTITTPCQLPATTPLRETKTQYKAFGSSPLAGTSISDRPSVVQVFGSGTLAAETDYTYDEYAASPVTPTPLALDPAYTSTTVVRGNPTTITAKCFVAAGPTCTNRVTHLWYDITGQVIKAQDGNLNYSYYSYGDSYTGDDGSPTGNTNTYLTQITKPTTLGVQHIERYIYGYNQGQLRARIDENNQPTSYTYSDPWKRITQTRYPDLGTTNVSYNDSAPNPTVTTTTILNQLGDRAISVTTLDALGRPIKTELQSDPVAPVNVDTTYDGLGRVHQVTNPYRSFSEPTYGVTTFAYDGLGRKALETHPDNGIKQWCYEGLATAGQGGCVGNTSSKSGSFVDQIDELHYQSQMVSDASGRLIAVMEPSTSGNPALETDYQYDGLDNLTRVDQWGGAQGNTGARVRTFSYDSLSQLVSGCNPEELSNGSSCSNIGTSSRRYFYDANGNITNKSDGRGGTSMIYDQLNRVTSKIYLGPSTTLPVNYSYDTSFISGAVNTIGHLTNEAVVNGGTVIAQRSPYAYDPMGRPTMLQECTPANCAGTPYQLTYTYDLAGNVSSMNNGVTNPTISVTMKRDMANHLSSVSSSLTPDSNHPQVLFQATSTNPSAPAYSPAGLANAILGLNPQTQQQTNAVSRSYDNRLRPLSEMDTAPSLTLTPASGSTASITVNGTEQQTTGAQAKAGGYFTVGGTEGSHKECDSVHIAASSPLNPQAVPPPTCGTVPDSGMVSATVNGFTVTAAFGSGSTAAGIASALASALNGAGSPITATVGTTAGAYVVTLTSIVGGSAGNYAFSVSSTGDFIVHASGSTLTGGGAGSPLYNNGYMAVTINGVTTANVFWAGTSTAQSIATALAAAIQSADSGFLNVSIANTTLTLTSKQTGAAVNWSITPTTVYDSGDFSASSFTLAISGFAGGANAAYGQRTIYSYSIPSVGGYSLSGNLSQASDAATGQWSYFYDPLNRLVGASGQSGTYNGTSISGALLQWGYDAFGNRLSQSSSTGMLPTSWVNVNPNNQVQGSSLAPAGVTYDNAGALTFDGRNSYLYDGEGRVCAVSNGAGYFQYIYDAEGNRVAKGSISRLSCDLTSNGFALTNSYVVGLGGEQITELGTTGNWLHTNVFANGALLATYGGTDTYFALSDWVGSKRVEITPDGLSNSFASLPFGDGLYASGSVPDATEHHFTGKERDTESGLDYFGARYYASNLGRWMSPDWADKAEAVPYSSLGNPQSLNLYVYVLNNPLFHSDADGHCCQSDFNSFSDHPGRIVNPGGTPFDRSVGQFSEGFGKVLLGGALMGTIATGNVPGTAFGATLVVNGTLSAVSTTVSGVTDMLGAATQNDAAGAVAALSATSNAGGLITTAVTGGNLEAGKVGSTLTSVGTLARNPAGALNNPATMVKAVKTGDSAAGLVGTVVGAIQGANTPQPPSPPPPSPPPCSVAGACHQ